MSKYDREFKIMAVELLNSGKSSEQVGKELGLGHDTARRWKNQLDSIYESDFKKTLCSEQAELIQLKKELREIKLERDILKKAVSIFSKNDGKSFDS